MELPRASTPMPSLCMIRISPNCGPTCTCCKEYRRFVENHKNPKSVRKVYRVRGVEKVACCDIVAGHVVFKCSRKYLSVKDFLVKLRGRFWKRDKKGKSSGEVLSSLL